MRRRRARVGRRAPRSPPRRAIRPRSRRTLDALAAAGIVAGDLVGTLCAVEPERYLRLWDALQPLYATYGATLSLKQLAASLDMSLRQVGRDAKELVATFGVGDGFRDALLVLRLRAAVPAPRGADAAIDRRCRSGGRLRQRDRDGPRVPRREAAGAERDPGRERRRRRE